VQDVVGVVGRIPSNEGLLMLGAFCSLGKVNEHPFEELGVTERDIIFRFGETATFAFTESSAWFPPLTSRFTENSWFILKVPVEGEIEITAVLLTFDALWRMSCCLEVKRTVTGIAIRTSMEIIVAPNSGDHTNPLNLLAPDFLEITLTINLAYTLE